MIICEKLSDKCNQKIDYFLARAKWENLPRNINRWIIFESHFLCIECWKFLLNDFEQHNLGRFSDCRYKIISIPVNVNAEIKKDFEYKVSPQIWNQANLWIPKIDIKSAIKLTKKS